MFLNNNVCNNIHTTIDIDTKTYFSLLIHRIISNIIIDDKNARNNAISEYLVILVTILRVLSATTFTSSFPLRPNIMDIIIVISLIKLDKNRIVNNNKHGIKTNRKNGFTINRYLYKIAAIKQ